MDKTSEPEHFRHLDSDERQRQRTIMEVCEISGWPQIAEHYIRELRSASEVRAELLALSKAPLQ